MAKIFISYRRDDSQWQTKAIYEALSRHVANPKEDIFFDLDSMTVGLNFRQQIETTVQKCDMLVAMIGRNWLAAVDPDTGRRRLDDPRDFVRAEIAAALKRNIPVVPVLLDGVAVPEADELPEDIRELSERHGVKVRADSFDNDVNHLVRGLLGENAKPVRAGRRAVAQPKAAPRPAERQREPARANAWIAPVIALGVLAVAGGSVWAWIANPGDWRGAARAESSLAEGGGGGSARSAETEGAAGRRPADASASSGTKDAAPAEPSAASAAAPSGSGVRTPLPPPPASQVEDTAPSAAAWAKVDRNDPAALRRFLRDHGASSEADTAKIVLRGLDADAWADAVSRNTEAAFNAYLAAFPASVSPPGVRAKEAQTRLASFRAEAREAGSAGRLPGTGREAASSVAAASPSPAGAGAAGQAPGGPGFRDCDQCPQMVAIPAGSFTMGSPSSETSRGSDEGPQRRVSVPAFAAGKYEVTWAEWESCVGDGGCSALKADGFGGGSRPVTNVSWDDTKAYTRWLSRKTGKTYRLLSEAEWEYAARAGTSTAYWWGATASHEYANYGKDQCCEGLASGVDRWVNTSPAGSFDANAFGLHDMHGNVREWVEDCYADSYSAGQPSDGSAFTKSSCSSRVIRGGSWDCNPQTLRSAYRDWSGPAYRGYSVGFRVARTNF